MRKKIDPFSSKKSYEEKCIWQTSQKLTISNTFSEEFSRCTKKGYEEKTTSYPFYSRALNISSPIFSLCCLYGRWLPPKTVSAIWAITAFSLSIFAISESSLVSSRLCHSSRLVWFALVCSLLIPRTRPNLSIASA